MMPPHRPANSTPPAPASALARGLESTALACILAVLVARPFMAEMPFRTSRLVLAPGLSELTPPPPGELLRVSLALVLLAAVALWCAAQALRGRSRPGGAVFAAMLAALGGWTLVSALRAADVRTALDGWLEQVSILLAGGVTMQLARERRRFGLIVVVLAALAGAMSLKAISQVAWEIPDRIQMFLAEKEKQLALVGVVPGTPRARLFETRMRDPAALGYLSLANVFASLMVVLTGGAAGLAAEKLADARRRRASEPPRRSGEIHLPTLAAVVAAAVALLGVVGLVLTRSKGGIGAGAIALTGAAAVILRPATFARHRRKLLAAAGAGLLAGIGAVAALGWARGSLPTRSLQVRWEYWVGAAGVVSERPVFGVGAGNFGDAYLRHRLPAAAESTKFSHNVLTDAAAQFGLPGAALYLGLLLWTLTAMTRPARDAPDPAGERPGWGRGAIGWCVFLTLVVLAARLVWTGATHPAVVLVEAILPASAFGVFLLGAMWAGGSLDASGMCGRAARTALGWAVAAFALHNLLTFTLWTPATATVFWISVGALIGAARAGRQVAAGRKTTAGLCLAALLAVATAGIWLWNPVRRRTLLTRTAQSAVARADLPAAIAHMTSAAGADPLDGFAPADLARLWLRGGPATGEPETPRRLARAVRWARVAWGRTPSPANARLLAEALWERAEPSEHLFAWRGRVEDLEEARVKLLRAVRRHASPLLLNSLAEVLYRQGRLEAAHERISQAVALSAAPAPKLYDNLGRLALALKRPVEAARAWRRYLALSSAAASAGERDEALAVAARAVRLDPMNLRFRTGYAQWLIVAGRFDQARREVREVLRIDSLRPRDSDLLLSAAEKADLTLLDEKIRLLRRRAEGD